jgi:hypothetical protein
VKSDCDLAVALDGDGLKNYCLLSANVFLSCFSEALFTDTSCVFVLPMKSASMTPL